LFSNPQAVEGNGPYPPNMAGHNKWSKVKRLKAVTDSRRGKVFSRLSRDITMAAKTGGGDLDGNARLRTLVLKAREANMPADNVDRAIKKGTGELPGVVFEEMTYEGYGPGGVAFVVQCTTDNKTRAAKDVRAAFNAFEGNLAQTGSVAFQFLHAGQFLIAPDQTTEDRLLEVTLDAEADDVITTEQGFEVRCNVHAFDKVAHALEKAGIKPVSSEIAYIPTSTVPVADAAKAKALVQLHDTLEELDDVQAVFSNEEMDESVASA
jgi:YebC/PmpR family DNA-binding regulatory protein